MEPVLLCTPNFSEGRRSEVIEALRRAVTETQGVKLMVTDSGPTVNRTVLAFGGPPEAVFEAAFRTYEVALKLIDMRAHQGVHPRFGAVDVCPFTPYRGIEIPWLKAEVERFARRVADTFRLPVFLYGESARTPERRWLPNLRKGGYEKLAERLRLPEWAPDLGPIVPHPRAGATAIGVRDFIAAFNLTLNTRSESLAKRIAAQIREKNGGLPHVQAIGWFLPELGFAQVSVNIVNLRETPLYRVFEAVEEIARGYGVRVTETEIIGLLPQWALLQAADHFLQKSGEATDLSLKERIEIALRSLLLKDFRPEERLPEWVFGPAETAPDLSELALRELIWRLAQQQPFMPLVPVVVQGALALAVAARSAAGLPARHAFAHPEYIQILQDTLSLLQNPDLTLDNLRFLSKKVLRGYAILRQIAEALSTDQRENLALLVELFTGAVESCAALYLYYCADSPEITGEKHDVELQGRFFHEEILKKVRL